MEISFISYMLDNNMTHDHDHDNSNYDDVKVKEVKQILEDLGWMVSRKDAIRFGGDLLLYDRKNIHSTAVVYVKDRKFSFLAAQRFSRICQANQKRAILAEFQDGRVKFMEISRWPLSPS